MERDGRERLLVDSGVIVIVVLTGSHLLPKQMLYPAELHPDRNLRCGETQVTKCSSKTAVP